MNRVVPAGEHLPCANAMADRIAAGAPLVPPGVTPAGEASRLGAAPNWEPADAGLVRPSATWTYVVSDNPFGSEMERFFAGMVKLFRSGKGVKKG